MSDTIRTEAELLAIFEDAQPAGSITAQDVRDFIVTSKFLQTHGWQFYLDSRFGPFTGSPSITTITGGDRHHLTIDGVGETLGHPTVGVPAFWDIVDNKIVPNGLNNFGLVRIAFTASSVGAGANRIEVELDTSGLPSGVGSPGIDIIYQQTAELVKGAGVEQHFNFVIPLFSGPTFQANGGVIYITPLNDVDVWLKALTAIQLYGAHPLAM